MVSETKAVIFSPSLGPICSAPTRGSLRPPTRGGCGNSPGAADGEAEVRLVGSSKRVGAGAALAVDHGGGLFHWFVEVFAKQPFAALDHQGFWRVVSDGGSEKVKATRAARIYRFCFKARIYAHGVDGIWPVTGKNHRRFNPPGEMWNRLFADGYKWWKTAFLGAFFKPEPVNNLFVTFLQKFLAAPICSANLNPAPQPMGCRATKVGLAHCCYGRSSPYFRP